MHAHTRICMHAYKHRRMHMLACTFMHAHIHTQYTCVEILLRDQVEMKADVALWCLWQVALQSVLVYGAAAIDRRVLNQAIYRKLRLVWISVIPLVTPPAPPEGFSIFLVLPLVTPPAPPERFSIILVSPLVTPPPAPPERFSIILVSPLVTPPALPERFSIILVSPLVTPPAPPERFSIILVSPFVTPPAPPERFSIILVSPFVTPPAPPERFSIILVSPFVTPPAPPERFSIISVLYKLLLLCSVFWCRPILKPVCTIWSFLVFASLFLYEAGLYSNWWKHECEIPLSLKIMGHTHCKILHKYCIFQVPYAFWLYRCVTVHKMTEHWLVWNRILMHPYLEEESVLRIRLARNRKLISDNFQSADRGHNPRHGIWNDPVCLVKLSVFILIYSKAEDYKTENKMHVDTKCEREKMAVASISTYYQIPW